MNEAAASEKLSPCNAPTLTYIQRDLVRTLSDESLDAQLVGSIISLSLSSFAVMKKDIGMFHDAWCQRRMSGSSLFFPTNVEHALATLVQGRSLYDIGHQSGDSEALAKAVTTA